MNKCNAVRKKRQIEIISVLKGAIIILGLTLSQIASADIFWAFRNEDGSTNWQYVANFSSSILIIALSLTALRLFLSQRQAIVDPTEGITRDRIYGETEWCGQRLRFIDTGGFIPEDTDIFNAAVREQAKLAIKEADLIFCLLYTSPSPRDRG